MALQTSLAALHAQLEHARHAQRPAYFTNAVLRGGDVDILELIRDADQLEASLFAYAPNNESTERTETPRAPQPRAVHIPTPLRQGVAGEPGEHSARFYLLAAEKLMQS